MENTITDAERAELEAYRAAAAGTDTIPPTPFLNEPESTEPTDAEMVEDAPTLETHEERVAAYRAIQTPEQAGQKNPIEEAASDE